MRKLLSKLLESLHINGRDLAVFLLSLLLAFSIWVIHNLSLRYNDYLTVSVVAKCNIDGHSDISSNRCDVIARCRTRGYNLIMSRMRQNRRVVEVDFSSSVLKPAAGDFFRVASSDLQEYAHIIYGNDVTVDYFVSDTLLFKFPKVSHKKVPVHPVASLSYREQYMEKKSIEVAPDSVVVYGEPFLLETVNSVNTKPINEYDLHSDIQGIVPLESVKGIRLSDRNVMYSVGVTRYVETKGKVQVSVHGVPVGKSILVVPSAVDMAVRSTYPIENNPMDGMHLYVDYDDIINSISGYCLVRTDSLPRGVLNYESEPQVVKCFVEGR